jgi:hypothetical protein
LEVFFGILHIFSVTRDIYRSTIYLDLVCLQRTLAEENPALAV